MQEEYGRDFEAEIAVFRAEKPCLYSIFHRLVNLDSLSSGAMAAND
jgi:hypothetical protein